MMPISKCVLLSALALPLVQAQFAPLRHYEGPTFFDEWDFYGFMDNTTWGNVSYVDRTNATTMNLAYVNSAGHAIMKVDNTTVLEPAELVLRPSVRVTSKYAFPIGSLLVLDLNHLPYGCSVWGAFWTLGLIPPGVEWPVGGEIDIIEGINRREVNQVALHTTEGCFSDDPAAIQTGNPLERNCTQDAGCTVIETKPNSYGSSFARAGGGVYATQFDLSGIYLWFWSRADVPASIRDSTSTSNMNPSDWGPPTASYPRSRCDIPTYFTAQQLIFTITMCGAWADAPGVFNQTCPGTCISNVIGTGNPHLNDAYFEIRYLRTYYPQGQEVPDTTLPPPAQPNATTTASTEDPTDTVVGAPSRPENGADALRNVVEWAEMLCLLFLGASAIMI